MKGQKYLEHMLKRGSVNSLRTAKYDKCGKNKHNVFLEKYPMHKKKFEECLKLNS